MKIAKIFKCGNSQALRLPKEFQFHSSEVEIVRQDGNILLREIPKNLTRAFELLSSMPDDFFSFKRVDLPPQKRENF